MPDIAAISAILGSIKTATEIAQLLKSSDLSLEKAETKLKLAELISALADAKIEIAGVRDLVSEKEAEIKALEEMANIKKKLKYQAPYYWSIEGDKREGPYCQQCYDKDSTLMRLQGYGNGYWDCKTCKNGYADSSYHSEISIARSDPDPYER